MVFLWMIMPFLALISGNFRERPSQRSNRGVQIPRELSVRHSFNQKEIKMENFGMRVIVYENQVDIEDLESYFGGFQGLVQTQSWEITFMPTQKKVTLLEIKEFYFTLIKMNKRYYKAKVNKKYFHLS